MNVLDSWGRCRVGSLSLNFQGAFAEVLVTAQYTFAVWLSPNILLCLLIRMSDIFTSVCQRKAENEHFWIMQIGDFDMHRKVMLERGSEFMKWKGKNGLLNYMVFFSILLNLEGIQFCHKKLWLKLVPPTPAVARRINRFEEGVSNGLQGGLCLLVSTSWPDPVPWSVGGTCMCFCPEK